MPILQAGGDPGDARERSPTIAEPAFRLLGIQHEIIAWLKTFERVPRMTFVTHGSPRPLTH